MKKGVKMGGVLLLTAALLLGTVSCGSAKETVQQVGTTVGNTVQSVGTSASKLLSGINNKLKADGRPSENVYIAAIGEKTSNVFFEWTVDSVTAAAELDGNQPTEGYKFVVADITTKNTFTDTDTIPVGNYDYFILYGDDLIEDYAYEEFMAGMYPDEVEQEQGEVLTGKLVFEVPVEVEDVLIAYYEIWDDDFEGNTWLVEAHL
jgi:hypothetical protein